MKKNRAEFIIQLNNLKISIGKKEIIITDRFTLILGKIKKNLLTQFQDEGYLTISKNYELIPIDNFIEIFQNQTNNFFELSKAPKLLDYLGDFRRIINNNIEIFSQYSKLIQSIIHTFKFNLLLKKKEILLKELKLSEASKRSSELTAISNLIEKLNESLINNTNKLKYLEEDFLQHKSKIDLINKTLEDYNLKIQNFNKQKKECFNQINRITRQMEGVKKETKDDLKLTIEFDENLSNAEKIQALQKKAKKIQYEINEIKTKLHETSLKFEELYPQYEIFEKDYQNLLDIIENDHNKINTLKNEYKGKIREFEDVSDEDLDVNNIQSIRLTNEIEEEIENLNVELGEILNLNTQIDPKNPENFSLITKKLLEFEEVLKLKREELIIKYDQNEILETIERFRKFETLINGLEDLLNKFLVKINLESQLQIMINEENNYFYVQLNFIRNKEDHMKFEELTTPEKIFFVIILHISIKILLKIETIIFTNAFLPSQYNKLSIYRTIRKILPVFESEANLTTNNLIFIISNLEMKKKIEKIRVINIEES
ncbi:MAG: hypothetical protein ACFE8L_02995 [Candidatus Hodarchaeota archaeon]